MKALKFQSNRSDDNHCLQACVKMALNTLYRKTSWDKINEVTHYKEGLYSWASAAAVAISKKIPGTKVISMLDYRSFCEKGEEYLREIWDQEWFETQKIMASAGFKREQEDAQFS